MPARKAPVSQAEVARYLKAARQAGFPVARVEISPDGKLTLHAAPDPTGETLNDWDAP